ncbi:hypothetical protein V8E53_006790 [Lactarius tabidus]
MSPLDLRIAAFALAVAHGTYFSLQHSTYLDTSNPFLTTQSHHLASTHFFASKRSFLNLIFLKWSWAWSSGAFLVLLVTVRVSATCGNSAPGNAVGAGDDSGPCAMSFIGGPRIFARLATASGAECGLHLGPASFVPVPASFCAAGVPVARAAHPELFPLLSRHDERQFVPRLRGGHDVSEHVSLLTLGVLFLADQLRQARHARLYVRVAVGALVALWVISLWNTSVYFYSPAENISGFFIGLTCFIFSQIPLLFSTSL